MYCSSLPLNLSGQPSGPTHSVLTENEIHFEKNLDGGISRKCLRFVTESDDEQETLIDYVNLHGGIILNTVSHHSGIYLRGGGFGDGMVWLTTVLFPNEEEAVLAKLTLA